MAKIDQSKADQSALPKNLIEFGQLPDEAHVDVKVVCGLFGIKEPTVWGWLRAGRLPKPRKFGRATRWQVGDLRKFSASGAV